MVIDGNKQYDLGARTLIGRMEPCAVRILDGAVSKQHAEVVFSGGKWSLIDLGSMNGTTVNGQRVQAIELKEGDEIGIGNSRLRFTLASGAGAAPHVEMVEVSEPMVRAKIERSRSGFPPVAQVSDVEQLKRDYEKLRIANELNRTIGLEPDIDKLLQRLLEETFKLLPADRGVILLMDPQTHKLATRAVKQAKSSSDAINLSSTIINQVFRTGASVLTTDAMLDPRFSTARSVMVGGLRSTLCVPMIYGNQILGIIHLDSLAVTSAFSEEDLLILNGVAAQAAQAIDNAYKARQLERNALARRDFERLLPPEVVEQVVSGNVRLERGGELRAATVLFTDIRGFTAWADRHPPAHIVTVLNDYFEVMVEAIHRHKGTLDKFMGDGILALFGAPIALENDAASAVSCALEMMRFLEVFNRESARSGDPFSIGIGIDTGPVVAGYMGSSKSMEYTAIGDHVNLASRLCGIAAPGQILITADTLRRLGKDLEVEKLAPVLVKGKPHPIPVYQVLGRRPPPRPDVPEVILDEDTGLTHVPPAKS